MAKRLLISSLRNSVNLQKAAYCQHKHVHGKREVVCYGFNGEPVYLDRWDYPFPAIRFKEITPDLQVLKDKEKGDWKKLSIEEKKTLYRASFCQTFAEMNAPEGHAKSTIAFVIVGVCLAVWMQMGLRKWVYPPLPITFDEDRRWAQYRRMVLLNANPITGAAAHAKAKGHKFD